MKRPLLFVERSLSAPFTDHFFTMQPFVLILIPLSFLLLPFRWVISWCFAVLIHEAGHYAAIRLCGGKVSGVQIKTLSVGMEVENLSVRKEVICASAGPFCSLLLLFVPKMPMVSICSFVQLIYNLLPLYPMDGGRIVKGLLLCLLGSRSGRVYAVIENAVILLLFLICLRYTLLRMFGLWPLCVFVSIMIHLHGGKIPCKRRLKRLQ